MNSFRSILAAAVLLAMVPTACGSSNDSESDSVLRVAGGKVCIRTECSNYCTQCTRACHKANTYHDVGLDCDESCEASCAPRDCSGSPCLETSYQFSAEGPEDPTLKDLCLKVTAKEQAENPTARLVGCRALAKLYLPETTIPNLECALREGCPADGSYKEPQPGTLGDECYEALRSLCGDDLRAGLNALEPMLRPEMPEALRTCFVASTTDDRLDCLDAWLYLFYW